MLSQLDHDHAVAAQLDTHDAAAAIRMPRGGGVRFGERRVMRSRRDAPSRRTCQPPRGCAITSVGRGKSPQVSASFEGRCPAESGQR
jgi:hypothetical protein